MRLLGKEIEVFKSSHSDNNPYEPGEKVQLGLGLYCETVVGEIESLYTRPEDLNIEDCRACGAGSGNSAKSGPVDR